MNLLTTDDGLTDVRLSDIRITDIIKPIFSKSNITKSNIRNFIFCCLLSIIYCQTTYGQQFYNYEEFFKSPEYIMRHKIKSVTMRVPTIQNDTSVDIYALQKLGFNPDGQLSWYEHDKQDRKGLKKYYTWYFYDNKSRRYLSKLLERCNGQDSLRELSNYYYDESNHLIHEEHHQTYVLNYNDWVVDYEWLSDTVRVRHSEINKKDTTTFDNQGRITGFEENSWKYRIEYDEQGRLKRSSYYWLNAPITTDNLIDQRIYHYNSEGNLERIESDAWEVVFQLDFSGLPMSSRVVDKASRKNLGWEMTYEYETRW